MLCGGHDLATRALSQHYEWMARTPPKWFGVVAVIAFGLAILATTSSSLNSIDCGGATEVSRCERVVDRTWQVTTVLVAVVAVLSLFTAVNRRVRGRFGVILWWTPLVGLIIGVAAWIITSDAHA
jgi:hypothetical protein